MQHALYASLPIWQTAASSADIVTINSNISFVFGFPNPLFRLSLAHSHFIFHRMFKQPNSRKKWGFAVICNNLLPTSQRTQSVSILKTNLLVLFSKIVAVYCENHMKCINKLWWQNIENLNGQAAGTCSYICAYLVLIVCIWKSKRPK
jgi:hypothetical protein